MRQKRAKSYKRLMALYVQTFAFRSPYQVLVSNDLIASPAAQQLDIVKLLASCVQGEIKPMITQCCVEALYKLGRPAQSTTNLAKTFERRRCNHREAVEPDECLKDVLGSTNKHRYVLATQSPALRTHAESIPGTPIIHFNPRGVLVLGAPSIATTRAKNAAEEGRRLEGVRAMEGVEDGGNVVGAGAAGVGVGGVSKAGPSLAGAAAGADATSTLAQGPKRRVKGPNPLSVRKRKADAVAPGAGAGKEKKGGEGEKGENGEKGKGLKRAREGEGERERDGRGNGTGTGGNIVEATDGTDERKKKKKRKRKNKSEVAGAIAELNAMNEAGGGGGEDEGEGEGEGEESD